MKKMIVFFLLPFLVYAGEVVSVQGDVKMFVDQTWQSVKVGTKIQSGTKIMTGVKSQVEILSASGGFLMKPMTLLTYHEKIKGKDSSTELALQNGKVEVKYQRPPEGKAEFRVQTPKSTASVRGTERIVSY